MDDVLDYESAEETLGKPGGADLQLGLATGPALYAWEEHPELGPLIERKFEGEGDVEIVSVHPFYFNPLSPFFHGPAYPIANAVSDYLQARKYVRNSSGVERTRLLAESYATQARDVLKPLPESEAKSALEALTERVIRRKS